MVATLERPASLVQQELALLGGPRTIESEHADLFKWPIVTREDEEAVLEVLRRGGMSGLEVTQAFETEFAAWQGSRYALGMSSGTAALHSAMFGCHIGVGDEIICPSITYWASAMPCLSLGGTVVFADVEPDSLCLDPNDIERHISPRTKAIVAVHYTGHPCDMDPIMEVARRHGLRVIEDCSHAQGGLYQGRKLGTIGDVGAMSLMSGKSFAIGEGGILVTDDREIYERAIAFGHYERYNGKHVHGQELRPYAGLPMGGYKYRMHQLSSAVGRVQLKSYDARCAEIRRAINYFWDGVADVPGVAAMRVDESTGSNMAGWYAALGHYRPEELGGLSVSRYTEALRAEGVGTNPSGNFPLHLHPLLNDCDVYGDGKPTRIRHSDRDLRQPIGSLPVSESLGGRLFSVPWFKHFEPAIIDRYIAAFAKVSAGYEELLEGDTGATQTGGSAGLSTAAVNGR